MNEHQNVNKNAKCLSVSRDIFYDLNPHNQFPATVHIQAKVINWSCGKNKRVVLIPDLSRLLYNVTNTNTILTLVLLGLLIPG